MYFIIIIIIIIIVIIIIIINIVIISELKFRICNTSGFQSPVAIGDLFCEFVHCNYCNYNVK